MTQRNAAIKCCPLVGQGGQSIYLLADVSFPYAPLNP